MNANNYPIKKHSIICCVIVLSLLFNCSKPQDEVMQHQGKGDVEAWITTSDRKQLLQRQTDDLVFTTDSKLTTVIPVDTAQQYQTIDGFGYALTGGSAWLLNEKLNAIQRNALLKE